MHQVIKDTKFNDEDISMQIASKHVGCRRSGPDSWCVLIQDRVVQLDSNHVYPTRLLESWEFGVRFLVYTPFKNVISLVPISYCPRFDLRYSFRRNQLQTRFKIQCVPVHQYACRFLPYRGHTQPIVLQTCHESPGNVGQREATQCKPRSITGDDALN